MTTNVTGYQIDAVSLSEYNKNQKVDLSEIKAITSKYRKILIENKILTTSDFLSMDINDLVELKGLGEKSVEKIKTDIEEYLIKI